MTELAALALLGLALGVVSLTTAVRPGLEPLDRDSYFARWAELHGGYDPSGSRYVRGWLGLVHALARPLARRGVQPDVVTVWSVWLALLVMVLARIGGRGWLLAGLVLVLSGLVDNLDGCVAVLQDRTSAWGYLLDSALDRVSDALFLVALVAAGCPGWLAVTTGFGCFLLEYVRARAGNAGGDPVVRITVAERSTRVLVLAPTLLLCGVLPARAGVVAAAGVGVLAVLTVVGLAQLAPAVRRQLAGLPTP